MKQLEIEMQLKEQAHLQEVEHITAVNQASERAHVSVLSVLSHDLKGSGTNASINANMLSEFVGMAKWDNGQQALQETVDSLLKHIIARV